MLNLVDIQESFGFKEATWKIEGELINTEKGLKRVIVWSDERKLSWHMLWRDELCKKTECLSNRMIQTKMGDRVLLTNAGWITVHDEITTLFSYKGLEKEFGEFLGKYFSNKVSTRDVEISDVTLNTRSEHWKLLASQHHFPEEHRFVLKQLQKESQRRLESVNHLSNKYEWPIPPVVSPIQSLNQGKLVFEKLYWENRSLMPEKGYHSMKVVLVEWLQRYGKTSLRNLLTAVNAHFPVEGEHGIALLAECLLPREFLLFLKQYGAAGEQSFSVAYEELKRQWNTSCQLVNIVSEWVDLSREKVGV